MEKNHTITTEEWRCLACKSLLGFVENKKTVRIKRKDLYLQFEGGKIIVNCCRCGKPNEMEDVKVK